MDNLFGDESDSDGSSEAGNEATLKPPNSKPNDESGTEEEPVKEEDANPDSGTAPAAATQNEPVLEDTDESDVEFNDDNVVEGRTKTKKERERERALQKERDRLEKQKFHPYSLDDEDEEKEEDTEKIEEKPPRHISVLDIAAPIPTKFNNKSDKEVTMHMTKLPNFVNINPEAYDNVTYDPEEEEQTFNGYVHNIMRWRYIQDPNTGELVRDEQGKLKRESNSRVVKWSDGSLTLHVGTEVFEFDSFPKRATKSSIKSNCTTDTYNPKFPTQFPGNGYLYLSQKANSTTDQKPLGTVLECMGPIESKLIPKPSLRSEAHKNLTLAVRQRNQRGSKIAEYVTQVDPEQLTHDRIKNKEDLMKSRGTPRTGRSSTARGSRRRPNRKFYRDEDAGNYDTVNIRHMKNGMMDEEEDDYDNMRVESDSENDEWNQKKRYKKKSRFAEDTRSALSEDEEDDLDVTMDGGESESDEDFNINSRKRKSRSKFIDDDDE